MRKLFLSVMLLALLSPLSSLAWESGNVKIIYQSTKTATLSDYYIEESDEIASNATFIVAGKKLDLVVDAEDIEKWLKCRKGKKFAITYGKVHGWLGDGETDYEVLMDAKSMK